MHSFIRYLITGGSLFLIDLATFLLFVNFLEVGTSLAQIISRSVGATVGFYGHKYFTFQSDQQGGLIQQGGYYAIITIFNITFSPVVVHIALMMTGDKIIAAKIIAEIFLVMETFILLRTVFMSKRKTECKK